MKKTLENEGMFADYGIIFCVCLQQTMSLIRSEDSVTNGLTMSN